jgi:hypothetical protein
MALKEWVRGVMERAGENANAGLERDKVSLTDAAFPFGTGVQEWYP